MRLKEIEWRTDFTLIRQSRQLSYFSRNEFQFAYRRLILALRKS